MQKRDVRVAVVGFGAIGKATAAVLQTQGLSVFPVDPRVESLPDKYVDVGFVCVPTHISGRIDTTLLEGAIRFLHPSRCGMIAVRSTVPVGWTRTHSSRPLVYLPSFARGDSASQDELQSTRLVVGSTSPSWSEEVMRLWPAAMKRFLVSPETAELSKLANNAYLFMSVAFANLMYDTSSRLGASWAGAAEILRADPRIGAKAYLDPSPDLSNISAETACLLEYSGNHPLLRGAIEARVRPMQGT